MNAMKTQNPDHKRSLCPNVTFQETKVSRQHIRRQFTHGLAPTTYTNLLKLIEVLFTIHKKCTYNETWHTLLNNYYLYHVQ